MLVGRRTEQALVDSVVERLAEAHSGTLIIRGEPGIGKSALLAYAEGAAVGVHVARVRGIESEVELPYAALHQLIRPLPARLEDLPAPQARALRNALGLQYGGPVDRFLVAAATLTLLADVADHGGGLLLLVDDAQWVDRASLEALLFVARRVQAEGIGLILAVRDDVSGALDPPDLPQLRLTGLDAPAASQLLAERFPAISPPVAAALTRLTHGNPLGLLEVPAVLRPEQLSGRDSLPDPLPAGPFVTRVFLEATERLPEDTRRLLLLIAAEEAGDGTVIARAATQLGLNLTALGPAQTAHLIRADRGHVEFVHPLVRSAVYQHATLVERRAAHLALAAVQTGLDNVERRAWHRAAAALGTDADVAQELEVGAAMALGRAGPASASAALERSAALTPGVADRGRRLLAAAEAAWASGDPQRTIALLDRAAPDLRSPKLRASADHLRGCVELRCGTPDEAYGLLLASSVHSSDPHAALESLALAGEAASFAGDVGRSVDVGNRAAELTTEPATPEDRITVAMLAGIADGVSGRWPLAARRLRSAVEAGENSQNPTALLRAGRAALYLGDDVAARTLHSRAVLRARETGAVSLVPTALDRRAFSDVLAGRLTDAAAEAEEGLTLAEQIGAHEQRAHHLAVLALVAAWRGHEDAALRFAAETQHVASQRRLGLLAATAFWAVGLLELARGRPDRAVEQLAPVVLADAPLHPAVQLWATPDLVEAAVRAGRPTLVTASLANYQSWAQGCAEPWALAVAARSEAMIAPDDDAHGLMQQALRRHPRGSRPLELARTHLLYGELLRRERQRSEARPHLRAALQLFERVGAARWAERAQIELRAAGETARHTEKSERPQFTAQELQIARLAAAGASNPEIAAQLYLSRRTVEYHLRKVFTKFGIASRGELVRVLHDA